MNMMQMIEQIEAHESALDTTNTEFQATLNLLRKNGELMVRIIQQLNEVNVNLDLGCNKIAAVFDGYLKEVRS